MPRIDERRQSPSASAGAPNIWHSGAVMKRRVVPITLLLLWVFPLSARPVNGGRDGAGPAYFTNFGASNDAAKNSYIDRYIEYLKSLGNGSGGYNNAGHGAGGFVGNFTPDGRARFQMRQTGPFAATNMTGVLMHHPKVTIISLRATCDSLRAPGCTASQMETDLRIITDLARANGVTIFVQTPQPCECAPRTSLTATIRKVYSWVKANYPNNYIDMMTDFSLPDGTINQKYFQGCLEYNEAGQALAYQHLKAKLGL